MQSFTRDDLLKRKTELETVLQQAADEYLRIQGGIQFCEALLAELDEPEQEIHNDSLNDS